MATEHGWLVKALYWTIHTELVERKLYLRGCLHLSRRKRVRTAALPPLSSQEEEKSCLGTPSASIRRE